MALIVDVALAITAGLNGTSFSMPFLAELTYNPVYELDKEAGLKVSVVPKAREIAELARGMFENEIQVDIGVQKKLAAADNPEVEALMDLVEELTAFIHETKRFAECRVTKVANEPVFSPEHMSAYRQFTSVITVTMLGVGP